MSDKDNIISLEERQRQKAEGDAKEALHPRDAGDAQARDPLPGKLVWLHCPACGTFEYTELMMAGGRTHNLCGNQVEEVELEIDLRAEYTIASMNLERLRMLSGAVENEKVRFEEYQYRLRLIAGGEVESYHVTPETIETLPVAELDPLGMIVSKALHKPSRHFAPSEAEDPAESETPRKPGAEHDNPPSKS